MLMKVAIGQKVVARPTGLRMDGEQLELHGEVIQLWDGLVGIKYERSLRAKKEANRWGVYWVKEEEIAFIEVGDFYSLVRS